MAQTIQTIPLLFDTKLNRPACVLLQACAGGDRKRLNEFFTSEEWLISPTPDMKLIYGTRRQWESLRKWLKINKTLEQKETV